MIACVVPAVDSGFAFAAWMVWCVASGFTVSLLAAERWVVRP